MKMPAFGLESSCVERLLRSIGVLRMIYVKSAHVLQYISARGLDDRADLQAAAVWTSNTRLVGETPVS